MLHPLFPSGELVTSLTAANGMPPQVRPYIAPYVAPYEAPYMTPYPTARRRRCAASAGARARRTTPS